uniref:Uncharacterized protein n=1 Tax=Arion vulgaris TaxID=1028688 RepID=A0A0B6ZCE0_9EUPU
MPAIAKKTAPTTVNMNEYPIVREHLREISASDFPLATKMTALTISRPAADR